MKKGDAASRANRRRARHHGVSRRQFLAGATAAGIAATLPPFFIACGDDDGGGGGGNPDVIGEREPRHLHFDLSRAPVENITIHAANSPSDGAMLSLHDDESRARHRELNPALIDVPDEQLTHFIEDVHLPTAALQLIWVTGSHTQTGDDVLISLHIHKPPAASRQAAERAAAAGLNPMRSAKALAYGMGGGAGTGALPDLDAFITPFEVAVALVFHTQGIMNLNLDLGTDILTLIETLPCDPNDATCSPFVSTLAFGVASRWPASTSGGWATLTALHNPDGTLLTNSMGEIVYRYDLDPDIAATARSVADDIKKAIFDAAQYRGTNWHPTTGMTVGDASGSGSSAALGGGAQSTDITVTGEHPAGTTVHGVEFTDISISDQTNRTVQIELRNHYLRYISALVQFLDDDGNPVPASFSNENDTTRAAFLGWIPSNYTVLGIPLLGDDVALTSFHFDVPSNASQAKVYYGSLGLGGDAFCPEAVSGSILTLTFDIGIPTMALILGFIPSLNMVTTITRYLLTKEGELLVQELLSLVAVETDPVVSGSGIFGGEDSDNASQQMANLGNSLLLGLLRSSFAPKLIAQIAQDITEDETLEFAGPLGIAFRIIAAAAELSALTQTVAEVLASPAIFTNTVQLSQTTTVTIDHDPDDFQFPSTARAYEVFLRYDGASKVTHCASGTLGPGTTEPIVVTFDNVPSGGMVTVDVYLKNDADCIVGRSTDSDGSLGPYGPVSGTLTSIRLTIKELLLPLTSSTEYVHTLKLEYQGGEHAWVETDAPTATVADLCAGEDDALCDLNQITVSQRTGMAGYSFRAGGQNVGLCDGGTASIQQVIQNVFLGQNAQSGFRQLPCGFTQPVGIVYEGLGPADGSGRNFFLEPSSEGVLLKSIVLDDSLQFDLSTALSWGKFCQPQDAIALVSTGYVVGVNRTTHKMEILELPQAASNNAQAPASVPFAVQKMGLGTREGLLASPVALTAFGATILILEAGNKRIQAVDTSGNPVNLFQSGSASTVTLDQSDGTTYLDIAVEGLGYMYVLSYVNSGQSPSDYRLDVYDPDGNHLFQQTGVAAARLAADTFRNLYTLNYETIVGAPRVEPSLSQWEPSTPGECP